MSMRRWAASLVLVSSMVAAGCGSRMEPGSREAAGGPAAGERGDAWRTDTLTQIGTLERLARGGFDGTAVIADLGQSGDFGLGTFDALDGEMVVLDGVVYQIRADGIAREADRGGRTPFAAVTFFRPTRRFAIAAPLADLAALETFIANAAPDPLRMLAVKVHGTFSSLVLRSPRRQTAPYPPLAEAIETQVEFRHTNVRGTMVGFRLPTYLGTVNAVGYHFHFISDDRRTGGHVLAAATDSGTVDVQTLERLRFTLGRR